MRANACAQCDGAEIARLQESGTPKRPTTHSESSVPELFSLAGQHSTESSPAKAGISVEYEALDQFTAGVLDIGDPQSVKVPSDNEADRVATQHTHGCDEAHLLDDLSEVSELALSDSEPECW